MYSSIQNAPIAKRMLIIKDWQIEFTGSACAAALLGFFDYWHTKLAGQTQIHSEKDIIQSMLGVFGRPAVRQGIKTLIELKAVSVKTYEGARSNSMRGSDYLFHPEVVEGWIDSLTTGSKNASELTRQDLPSKPLSGIQLGRNCLVNYAGSDELTRQDLTSTPYIYKNSKKEEKKEDPEACFVFSEPDPEAIATLPEEAWITRPDPKPGVVEVSVQVTEGSDPEQANTLTALRSTTPEADSSNTESTPGINIPPPRVSARDSNKPVKHDYVPTVENFSCARKQDLAYRYPQHGKAQRYGVLALAHFEIPHFWVGPGAWDYAAELYKGAEMHLRSLDRRSEKEDCAKWISARVGYLVRHQDSAGALLQLEQAYTAGKRTLDAIAASQRASSPMSASGETMARLVDLTAERAASEPEKEPEEESEEMRMARMNFGKKLLGQVARRTA